MALGKKVAILGLGEGQKIPYGLNQYLAEDRVSIAQDYKTVPHVSLELATHQSKV